jgi:hypothetical protein
MARQPRPAHDRGGRARNRTIIAGVMVAAFAAGGLVAGLPETVPDDVEPSEIRVPTPTTAASSVPTGADPSVGSTPASSQPGTPSS